jgi:hypothetical protein
MLIFVEVKKSGKPQWYSHMLTPDEFKLFAASALAGERHKKAWIGVVKPSAAGRIQAVCGKTVSKIMVESDTVWHSYKKRGHNLQPDDIFHITTVINAADSITKSSYGHQNNEVLLFSKDISGNLTFVVEVRVNFGGWLSLVTCYRQ